VLSRLSSTVRPLVNAAKRFALVLALSFGPQIIALKGPSPAFLPVFSLTYRSRCLPWLHNLPRLRVGDVLVDFCSSEHHSKPTHFLVKQKCKRESARARIFESIGVREGVPRVESA
jgi:hypothetical protein